MGFRIRVIHGGTGEYHSSVRWHYVKPKRDYLIHIYNDIFGIEVHFVLLGDGSHHVMLWLTGGKAGWPPKELLGEFGLEDMILMRERRRVKEMGWVLT